MIIRNPVRGQTNIKSLGIYSANGWNNYPDIRCMSGSGTVQGDFVPFSEGEQRGASRYKIDFDDEEIPIIHIEKTK